MGQELWCFDVSLKNRLWASHVPEDEWLWCMYCGRFFQARHLRTDYAGNCESCSFCRGAGFDVAIFAWDVFADRHPKWPQSTSALEHGLMMKLPDGQTVN